MPSKFLVFWRLELSRLCPRRHRPSSGSRTTAPDWSGMARSTPPITWSPPRQRVDLRSWPDDPETVEEAKAKPGVFAHKTIGQVANYLAVIISKLRKPAVLSGQFTVLDNGSADLRARLRSP